MLEFCGNKGIKQEYSNARTPQQNEVAERMNRTPIEAARTMLADSLLPTTFWAEALEAIAQKHLGTVPENNSTSTLSVNSGSEPVNTGELDPDDSPMPELEIFHKSKTGIFDEASYDEEGVVTDFNSLPTEIEVSPTLTLRIHNIYPKSQIRSDPKSAVQTRSKEEPKKIYELYKMTVLVKANARELLQFKLHTVTPKTSHLNAVKRIFSVPLRAIPNIDLSYGNAKKYTIRLLPIQLKLNMVAAQIAVDKVEKIHNRLNEATTDQEPFDVDQEHNQVGFLRKPDESAGFAEIVDFLRGSNLSVIPPTPPTTQPIPSEATTIAPLSQPAPPIPIAETTTASPSPSPSPAHVPMEHTFEQPSTDPQPPTPRQEATTSQLMTRIGELEKQLKETKQNFGTAILNLVDRVKSLEVVLERNSKRVLLSNFEEEETEAQGRKTHDLDPLVSLVQELVTPSKTVNASGEEQVEDISPTTLEAAAILTKVHKIKSVDKGKRYKRRKSSKEFAGTGLDFEEIKSAFEKVNTGGIEVSSDIEEINAGSWDW
ncbi:ribonuclease H-like domain-containing protein [Tanacetum coccineum]|uniref:Ribonuclease H-like domain-containing protein n=1 Tax=Tanacetum coccineum TaxID=301880 RepID=A0ABQ5J1W8_9ASTR